MCAVSRASKRCSKRLIFTKQPRDVVTECHNAGTRERSHVNADFRGKFGSSRQSIGQNQTTFGIGVENFDGQTTQRSDDIGRLQCRTRRQVFHGRHQRHHVFLKLHFGGGLDSSHHDGSPRHIEFHLIHRAAGLEGDAPRIKGYALTHQNNRSFGRCRPLPGKFNENGIGVASFAHADHTAHAGFVDGVFVEHPDGKLAFGGLAR